MAQLKHALHAFKASVCAFELKSKPLGSAQPRNWLILQRRAASSHYQHYRKAIHSDFLLLFSHSGHKSRFKPFEPPVYSTDYQGFAIEFLYLDANTRYTPTPLPQPNQRVRLTHIPGPKTPVTPLTPWLTVPDARALLKALTAHINTAHASLTPSDGHPSAHSLICSYLSVDVADHISAARAQHLKKVAELRQKIEHMTQVLHELPATFEAECLKKQATFPKSAVQQLSDALQALQAAQALVDSLAAKYPKLAQLLLHKETHLEERTRKARHALAQLEDELARELRNAL